jgi:hypothetical protein
MGSEDQGNSLSEDKGIRVKFRGSLPRTLNSEFITPSFLFLRPQIQPQKNLFRMGQIANNFLQREGKLFDLGGGSDCLLPLPRTGY